jgi:hypothetical protein
MKYYFYPQSLYTCTVAFADVFNDIGIRVYDPKTNDIVGFKPVPVTLSPKEKIAHILNAGEVNDVDPQVDNYLPRISIAPPDISWDAERMRGKYEKRLLNVEYNTETGTRKMNLDVQVVPIKLSFEVSIWAKYLVDMYQLIENIMPHFSPEIHVSFKERNFGIERKSRVVMTSSSKNFVYEYGESEQRILQWNFTFDMDGVLFKPMEDRKEILCSIISIAGVPCKKTSFYGDKIIAYEPYSNTYESILTKNPKLSIHNLDASDSYDLMVKYWAHANNNLDTPHNIKCVEANCSEDVGVRPVWSDEYPQTSCHPTKKKPCIKIDSETQNISAFWQEEVVGTDNKIRIISWNTIYNSSGVEISGAYQISDSLYPMDCQPVYTIAPTSESPSSVITPPITSTPPSSIPEIPNITGCELPEYYTTA